MVPNRFAFDRLAIWVAVALALIGSTTGLRAQLGPAQAPQARSQEELDAYLEILTSSDPEETVVKTDRFASRYPKSELLGTVFQYQTQAYQEQGDFDGVLGAGKRSLGLHPDNLNTLLILASTIPNATGTGSDSAPLLERAEEYARRVLTKIKQMRIPRQISLERWETIRGQMAAQSHEALGHIAAKRGQLQVAVAELERAAFDNPIPQGSQFFRLGVAYVLAGNNDRAESVLRRAATLGPDLIRERALSELHKIEKGKPTEEAP